MTTTPDEIRRELSPTEQVLWSGQPRQGVILRGSDVYVIPFSLMWCGFAIFWEISVASTPKAPGFFVVWGVPFVAIGLYMVVARFFAEAKQRSRTFYAVTNERVIIVSGVFTRKVNSLNLRTLADLSITERSNGDGTISFGGGTLAAKFGIRSGWPGTQGYQGPSFDLIANAKSVFEVIRCAQRGAV